jgi:hypothetical protein
VNRLIYVNDIAPAPLSFRHPLGVTLDFRLTMKDQRGVPVDPTRTQFVLLPRSHGGIYAYDMQAYDVANGIARVEINGTAFTDRSGYGIEVYARTPNPSGMPTDPPVPTALIAQGVMAMQGTAHQKMGPLGMISVPTVTGPAGPVGATGAAGPTGDTGQRGSVWYSGAGAPVIMPGQLIGDMYLDDNGDVWRFNGEIWLRGSF